MWITVATVNENISMDLAIQQITDAADVREKIVAEGVETAGKLLPPHNTQSAAIAAFSPGTIYIRHWDLESSAQRSADLNNNHPSKALSVIVKQQEV